MPLLPYVYDDGETGYYRNLIIELTKILHEKKIISEKDVKKMVERSIAKGDKFE